MKRKVNPKEISLPLIVSDEAEKKGKFFNFPEYAKTIRDIVLNPKNKTPLVISINGRWGSGKTTLMRTIQSELDEPLKETSQTHRKCKTVWFQAWKYNDTDSILAALIHTILDAMRRGTLGEQFQKIFEEVRQTINWWKLPTQLLKTLGYDLSEIVEKPQHATKASFYEDFRDTFRRLLFVYLNDITASFRDTFGKDIDDARAVLVVFIDDLDRCHEEKIIDVLEGVKLFLDQQGCIFILGVDRPVIEGAVATRFGEEKRKEYLDKIIQVNFNLPPLRPGDITGYIEELNRGGRIHPDLNMYLPIIREHIEKNPRTVKRFVNDLSFQLSLAGNLDLLVADEEKEDAGPRIEAAHLVRWNVLVYSFPDFARVVLDDPGVIKHMLQYQPGPGVDEEETLKDAPSHLQPFLRNKKLMGLLQDFPQERGIVEIFVHQSRSTESVEIGVTVGREGFRIPEIGRMVKIPAGEFLYGDEKAKHSLDEYYIDIYPVTNAEYKKFVKAGGYDNKDYWTEEGWGWIQQKEGYKKPRYWEDKEYEAFNRPDHPVVGVSWYEAWAYAKWVGKRLPTELEWEKAARGVDGREYPWGDAFDPARCNTDESGIGSTTPVTRYKTGKSPYGCYDMAGNVWEWTSSLYKDYPYKADDGREDPKAKGVRVLRGGSWLANAVGARASSRDGDDPDFRNNNFGFRCARTP